MRVGIALGANVGNCQKNLTQASQILKAYHDDTMPFLQSSLYATPPFQCPSGSPDFLNAVVEMEWHKSPLELLELTQSIQRFFGRTISPVRNSPRPLDLDILYIGNWVLKDNKLTLPHPRIAERAFVLVPLAEICPDLILPGYEKSVKSLLNDLSRKEGDVSLVSTLW